jgi:hypothetical protein
VLCSSHWYLHAVGCHHFHQYECEYFHLISLMLPNASAFEHVFYALLLRILHSYFLCILSTISTWLSQDTSVYLVTYYRLDVPGTTPGRDKIFLSSVASRLWGPPSLLSNGYQGLFPRGLKDQGVRLSTHLRLMPRSRMVELYLHSSIRLHGMAWRLIN